MFARWKPGHLYLTATRLLFYQGPNKLLELPVAAIRAAEVAERRWVSNKTCPQLAVQRVTERGESNLHFRVDDPVGWRDRLQTCVRAEQGSTQGPGRAGKAGQHSRST